MRTGLVTVKEIAERLGVSDEKIRGRLAELAIEPVEAIEGVAAYGDEIIERLVNVMLPPAQSGM
jgi:predicted ArsR family transcriptional regulator